MEGLRFVDIVVFLSEQWLLVSILAVLVTGLIFVEGKRSGSSLSFHEVTRIVNSGEAILLDIRDIKDFKAGHIVDSLNIPHQKLAERISELDKYKEKTVVLVDKMGQHSGGSGKLLKEKGFVVSRLQGGISEWIGQNLPVVKS